MAAQWPASLPQTWLAAVQEAGQPGKIRSQMETGAPKQRPRFTGNIRQLTMAMHMTGAQVVTFREFYRITLGMGSTAFTSPDPFTDEPVDFRFVDEPAYSMVRPAAAATARLWQMSATVEVLP